MSPVAQVIEDSEDSDCQIQRVSPSGKKSPEDDNEITEIIPDTTSGPSLQNEQALPTEKAPNTATVEHSPQTC